MEMSDESVSRTNVRPLSGSVKTDESVSRASVRPLSESVKPDESVSRASVRPLSGSVKTDEACPEQAFVRYPNIGRTAAPRLMRAIGSVSPIPLKSLVYSATAVYTMDIPSDKE